MDKRRFVPRSEGLEIRNLLSTASTSAANPAAVAAAANRGANAQVTANTAVAETIQTKFQRIENLPFFLGRLTENNKLPDAAIAEIQTALRTNVAALHASTPQLVNKFNVDLRRVLTNQNIRPSDAQTLSNDFDAVLKGAGASATTRAQLRDGMNQLTQFDSTQRTSAIVVANHYATVLQVALGTGRPLLQPASPRLTPAGRTVSKGMDFTRSNQPTFTGSYTDGATIQIVDSGGRVLGTSAVTDASGRYSVKIATPLPDGKYTVFARATDQNFASELSKPYTFTIRTPVVTTRGATPSGPR
ncbi:Ig-like domain-containing protein [Tundrisphaera sp. TA3]|uniref:Ig-like domain-containing protein n=1 Tax=Tundrisphaera sp. TA3 TaxID=3435775 RepID=UPI003EBA3499